MPDCLQIAYSGAGGANTAAVTLAAAGQSAAASQQLLFWGVEPLPDHQRERCEALGMGVQDFPKRRGVDLNGQRMMMRWLHQNTPPITITHLPAALITAATF